MIPMIAFFGPHGGLNWDNTQTMMRHNWLGICNLMVSHGEFIDTYAGQRKFESDYNFDAFKCEGRCGGRVLPLDCAQMDHRIAQAKLYAAFDYKGGTSFDTTINNQFQQFLQPQQPQQPQQFHQPHQFQQPQPMPTYIPSEGVLGRQNLHSTWEVCDQGTIVIIPHQGPQIIEANYTYEESTQEVTVTFPSATGLNGNTKTYNLIELMQNDISNVRPLCPPCNGARNGKSVDY